MKYNPHEREAHWQEFRENNKTYAFNIKNNDKKPTYSIDTPPPTVSGKLHIGHIFSYTQAELIARYKRMTWHNVFFPMWYDDNGIPTEQLVEKELKINIRELDRKEFVNKCLQVNEQYRDIYKWLRQSLGMSVDRSHSYATISPEVQQIAQQRFVALYKQWHITAKEFPALRCTKNQTTIAQAETEEKEYNEYFNDIAFRLDDPDQTELVIATTRPEMLPACLAVFVHPDDTKYQHMIGHHVITPLDHKVPILADEKVKMDKGTGAVMCCSYGDETDMYWILKHKLTPKIIINRYGKMQETWFDEIDNLKIAQAREAMIGLLEAKWAIVQRTAIVQSKMVSERGKMPVEIIPVHQRFVNILDHKEAIKQRNDEMTRLPEFMQKRSTDWIDNLARDRNISRSRKFGIPIPVRYSEKTGEIILPSEKQLARGPIDPTSELPDQLPDGHTSDDIRGEELVLDTRFTSWLTPSIHETFLKDKWFTGSIMPFSLRPQAHDIIRTRLLYTTIHANLHYKQAPFENIMISGHVLAWKNEKISKSKGNAKFEPVQLIEQYGADAVRYRALSGQLGKDMVFDDKILKNGIKLVNKLRNAFQFMKMQIGEVEPKTFLEQDVILYPTDQRILAQLQNIITTMTKQLDNYEYGLAKITFEEFFRHDLCDNYLELIKLRVYKPELFDNGEQKKQSAQFTLYTVINTITKLMAPYLPHVTEEIYQDYFAPYEKDNAWNSLWSIHLTAYPEPESNIQSPTWINNLLDVVSDVRKYKTEQQISLGADIASVTIHGPSDHLESLKQFEDDLKWTTKAEQLLYQEDAETKVVCA